MNQAHPRWPLPGALALLVLAVGPAWSAPPRVDQTTPLGLRRGTAAELTVQGAGLSNQPRLVAPFRFTAGPSTATADGASFKASITVDPATPLGVYPVRVVTDDGLSNAVLLAVGQFSSVAEREDNGSLGAAQVFEAPAVLEGQVAGSDVDVFRFRGRKGQRIVVDAQCARIGSGADPVVRLSTAAGAFLASADDTPGLLTDARLFAVLPADGEYAVELSDTRFKGANRPVYRLLVGEVPAAEEVYPLGGREGETVGLELRGGTLEGTATAAAGLRRGLETSTSLVRVVLPAPGAAGQMLDVESMPPLAVDDAPSLREPADPAGPPVRAAAPVVLEGRIDPPGDEDRFVVVGPSGQKLRVAVEAASLGSALDAVLQVVGPDGKALATSDDTTTAGPPNQPARVSFDPVLEVAVPTGQTELTIVVKGLEKQGGPGHAYRVRVVPVEPEFDLELASSETSVPRKGTAAIEFKVQRRGYNGPIGVEVLDLPAGLSVRRGAVAEGQVVGSLSLSADADAPAGPHRLELVGRGQVSGREIAARGTAEIVFARQSNVPTCTVLQRGLAMATARPGPVALDTVATPIEIAHGFPATFKVKAAREKGGEGELTLSPPPLPPGLAIAPVKLAANASEVDVAVATTTDLAPGTVSIALLGKGKIGGEERTVGVPAVTFAVVRPAAVELAGGRVEVKPGASVEVRGKVVRRGGFADAVTVKPGGLPAGVKAEPVVVAAGATDFTLRLTAEPKAAAATASASVVLAFQVNKADYPPAISAPLAVTVAPAP